MTSSINRKYTTYHYAARGGPTTAIVNMHKKIGEDRTRSAEDMLAGRQTHRHRQTRSSQYSAALSAAEWSHSGKPRVIAVHAWRKARASLHSACRRRWRWPVWVVLWNRWAAPTDRPTDWIESPTIASIQRFIARRPGVCVCAWRRLYATAELIQVWHASPLSDLVAEPSSLCRPRLWEVYIPPYRNWRNYRNPIITCSSKRLR